MLEHVIINNFSSIRCPLVLLLIGEQTPEMCIEAVKRCGYALQYVKEQTPQICMEAVKQYSQVLQYVKEL
jgi:hypothetical protein